VRADACAAPRAFVLIGRPAQRAATTDRCRLRGRADLPGTCSIGAWASTTVWIRLPTSLTVQAW